MVSDDGLIGGMVSMVVPLVPSVVKSRYELRGENCSGNKSRVLNHGEVVVDVTCDAGDGERVGAMDATGIVAVADDDTDEMERDDS